MVEYDFNPEHGEFVISNDPVGGKGWQIYLNQRGEVYVSQLITRAGEPIKVNIEHEGRRYSGTAYLSFGGLIGADALIDSIK